MSFCIVSDTVESIAERGNLFLIMISLILLC